MQKPFDSWTAAVGKGCWRISLTWTNSDDNVVIDDGLTTKELDVIAIRLREIGPYLETWGSPENGITWSSSDRQVSLSLLSNSNLNKWQKIIIIKNYYYTYKKSLRVKQIFSEAQIKIKTK